MKGAAGKILAGVGSDFHFEPHAMGVGRGVFV